MPRKRFHRFKLLLDEGIPVKKLLPRLNKRHDLKHIRDDLNKAGLTDSEIYQIASKLNRLILTLNGGHYKNLIEKKLTGVIDLSSKLTPEQIDKKIFSFLK